MASEPLEIERLDRGVLSFRGPLTMENVSPFMNAVRREDAPTMILDLTNVPYLDSSGLGSLVSACTSCTKSGRRPALGAPEPNQSASFTRRGRNSASSIRHSPRPGGCA